MKHGKTMQSKRIPKALDRSRPISRQPFFPKQTNRCVQQIGSKAKQQKKKETRRICKARSFGTSAHEGTEELEDSKQMLLLLVLKPQLSQLSQLGTKHQNISKCKKKNFNILQRYTATQPLSQNRIDQNDRHPTLLQDHQLVWKIWKVFNE